MSASFVVIESENKPTVYLNLDQVRRVEVISGGVRLIFDGQDSFEIRGVGSLDLLERLKERTVTLDGKRLPPEAKP